MILGDDHLCKVTGMGTFRVRMFDGMVQTLINVKHVPKLKNLVTIDYLEWNSCSFSSHARSGVLNINNGAMVVMRGRRLENNLYRLEGSIVTEDSNTAAMAQDQQDLHRLWHFHLEHMGD